MKRLAFAFVVFAAFVTWQITMKTTQNPTGTIQGRVIREGTNTPIPEALVYLNLPTAPAVGAPGAGNANTVTVTTDVSGNFVIRDVPPGKHVLYASRDGYFGPSRGAVESNVHANVTVTSGNATEVSFTLIPGGVVAGHVLVPSGDAAADISVQALRMMYQDGVPILQPISTRTTDDHGDYRLFRLPPGRYYVVATPAGPRPVAGARSAAPAVAPTEPTPVVPITTVRTFYPDVLDPGQSVALDVRGADEATGINIRLQPLGGAKISGQITSTIPPSEMVSPAQFAAAAAAQAAAGATRTGGAATAGPALPTSTLTLLPHDVNALQDPNSSLSMNVAMGSPDDGRFDLRNVPPGKYDVFASLPDVQGYGPAQPPGRAATPIGYGRATVEVGNRDLDGIRVTVHHGVELKGRITIDGTTPPSVANVRVSVQPADSAAKVAIYQQVGRFQPVVDPDGTFTIPAVPEAQYRFQVTFGPPQPIGPVGPNSPVAGLPLPALPAAAPPLGPNPYVADIRLGGTSVYDSGFSVDDSSAAQIEVLVRTDGGGIDGVVRGADKMPASGATVVLIPAQSRRGNPSLYRTAESDAMGRFSLTGVAPGQYKVFAWDNVLGAPYRNAEFLTKYEERGVPVNVIAGARIGAGLDLIVVNPRQ